MASRSVPGVGRAKRGQANPMAAYRAGTRKSRSRSRSGPGYDRNKGNARTRFDVVIDYTSWDMNLAEAREFVRGTQMSFKKDVAKSFDSGSNMSNLMWSIQVDGDKAQKDLAKIVLPSLLDLQNLPRNMAREMLGDIGKIGVSEIRKGILKPEGRPRSPRYDTGEMYRSVDYKVRGSGTMPRVEIGWTRNYYKYFTFQEQGTFDVGPMNAIKRAQRSTAPMAYNLMNRFLANYSKKSGFSGGYRK